MAEGQDAPYTNKNKRRISSIPITPGRHNSSPVKKQAKGQGKEVEINAVEALPTEIERVLSRILDKKLDLLASRLETKIETKIAELEAKFLNVENEFKNLKDDVDESINHVEYTLRQGIDSTWEYAVRNEQYSRKNNLRVLGLE